MGAAKSLDSLLDDATLASARAMGARDEVREKAISAIRKLEHKLRAAIVGDTLRGLSALTGGLEDGVVDDGVSQRRLRSPLQGARVRGDIDAVIKFANHETLVLSRDGCLVMATRGAELWTTRPAADDDLQVQDLASLAKVLQTVLERHIVRADKSAASYARVQALADRLLAAVGWV